MDRSEDPKHKDAGKFLDEMTPDQQRYFIESYHLALDDPDAFFFSHKIIQWLSPYFAFKKAVRGFCRRQKK